MPKGLDDAVRAYQLPQSAPGQPNLSQYNLSSNTPIRITPGFNGSGGSGQTPPLQTGSSHFDMIVTHYLDQAAVEAREA
jgi:hypothetical protein